METKSGRMRPRSKREQGFTLVEVLAAVVIIGILAVVAVLKVVSVINNSHDTAAIDEVSSIGKSEEAYRTIGAGSKTNPVSYGTMDALAADTTIPFSPSGDTADRAVNVSQSGYVSVSLSKTGTKFCGTSDNSKVYVGCSDTALSSFLAANSLTVPTVSGASASTTTSPAPTTTAPTTTPAPPTQSQAASTSFDAKVRAGNYTQTSTTQQDGSVSFSGVAGGKSTELPAGTTFSVTVYTSNQLKGTTDDGAAPKVKVNGAYNGTTPVYSCSPAVDTSTSMTLAQASKLTAKDYQSSTYSCTYNPTGAALNLPTGFFVSFTATTSDAQHKFSTYGLYVIASVSVPSGYTDPTPANNSISTSL